MKWLIQKIRKSCCYFYLALNFKKKLHFRKTLIFPSLSLIPPFMTALRDKQCLSFQRLALLKWSYSKLGWSSDHPKLQVFRCLVIGKYRFAFVMKSSITVAMCFLIKLLSGAYKNDGVLRIQDKNCAEASASRKMSLGGRGATLLYLEEVICALDLPLKHLILWIAYVKWAIQFSGMPPAVWDTLFLIEHNHLAWCRNFSPLDF